MSGISPVLKEEQPELAEVIEQIMRRFDRSYDLSQMEDASTLAEGLHEIGGHIALNGARASVSIDVGGQGIVSISVNVTPKV